MSTAKQQPALDCGPDGCEHTEREHEAFDAGFYGKPNIYEDDPHLREIWEIGNSASGRPAPKDE